MPINWDKLIEIEDKIISNSDRKHRYHFKSIEVMSEELIYQESIAKYQEDMLIDDTSDFIQSVNNEKLKKVLSMLTDKQKQVIELYYWHNLKHHEIAKIMDCSQQNVSHCILNALSKIKRYLAD